MATIGIDLGNYNVKTDREILFKSKYTLNGNIINTAINTLVYKNTKYFLGEGELETTFNKAQKLNKEILLLNALAKSTMDRVNDIVIGLPISQYKDNKDALKEEILKEQVKNFIYNEKEREVYIRNVEVFPECAGAYYSLNNKPNKSIIIDIGGGTTNLCTFEKGKLVNFNSLAYGTINLFSKVRDHLNAKYSLKLKLEDIEDIIVEGLKIEGENIDFNFMNPILREYINILMNELKLNFPYRTHDVLLSGGGSSIYQGLIKREIKHIEIIRDYMFANAKGFKKVGENLW